MEEKNIKNIKNLVVEKAGFFNKNLCERFKKNFFKALIVKLAQLEEEEEDGLQ